jgi:hypothetical protein
MFDPISPSPRKSSAINSFSRHSEPMNIADLVQSGEIHDRAFYQRLEAADRDEIAAIVS